LNVAVLRRFGTLTFKEVLQPAVDYATGGFPISERIASDWKLPKRNFSSCAHKERLSAATWTPSSLLSNTTWERLPTP